MAGIGSLSFLVLTVASALGLPEDAVGVLFMLTCLIPGIIGIATATAARDRRLANPFYVWIPLAWNYLLVGVFLLLCVIGLLGQ
jgi:predicted permease